jgi:hypothetical protein
MTRLFVCEKRHQAELYLPHIHKDDAIILCQTITSYLFDYPKKLAFSQAPYSSQIPQYKPALVTPSNLYVRNIYTSYLTIKDGLQEHPLLKEYFDSTNNNPPDTDITNKRDRVHKFLASFDEIIYACDHDLTGTRGFDFLFSKYYKIEDLTSFSLLHNINFSTVAFSGGLDPESIKKGISERKDFFTSKYIQFFREKYLKKDFFEYNYNLNSLILINKAYHLAIREFPFHLITKNFIQTLHILYIDPIPDHRLVKIMERKFIGQAASRSTIISKLIDLNLILLDKKNPRFETEYKISPLGITFISLLHRKLNDPHLSERISRDLDNKKLSVKSFKEKYETYLSKAFSRQKRHINKIP